ncbi:MAG: methyltransferase domain-containing protein [Planctomycetaceae bacterium]|nr:methyltransferase domain-containing protein [Planctomycetaceae bacterium]
MALADYYNRVNLDLLQQIPPAAQIILEVGCGAGAMAEAYRRINPAVHYLGIELNPEAAQAARGAGRLDRVITGDAAAVEPVALGLPALAAGPGVDCLIFGDVLEHMVDPWSVLARLAGWVREGGLVLACIPNVQHYSVIVNLLRGRWSYHDEGLLDRTHLRFFTLEGIHELFTRARLEVYDVQPRMWGDANAERFRQIMTPVLGPLGIDPARFAAQTQAVQYMVRAVRGPAPGATATSCRRLLLWSLLGSVIGSEVRIQEPHRFLATMPGVRVVTGTGLQFVDLGRTLPGEDRVFVEQRVVIPIGDHLQLQRVLLEQGYLIVAEFDDDPLHFSELVSSDFFALRSCHGVQTTTEPLAQVLREYNPNVQVFPNQLAILPPPRDFFDSDVEVDTGRGVSVSPATLFFGALNREADWAPFLLALNRVLAELKGLVRVLVVHDQALFQALETTDKAFEPLCSYDRYHSLLHMADLAWLPLEPTRFNRHKSDLKFLECAGHGVAVLASPTVYSGVIRHGETGLIYGSQEGFRDQLVRLIVDTTFRRRLATSAYREVAENRLLARHYRQREAWYRAMLGRLPELNRELMERAPELKPR